MKKCIEQKNAIKDTGTKFPYLQSFVIISFLAISSVFVFISCREAKPKNDESVVINPKPVDEETTPKKETENKSNEELIAEVAIAGIDIGKTVIKNMKVNDSIRLANREQMFAYKIGLPISNEDALFEAYKSLGNMESVFVLEKSRKEFYLIKYEGKTEEELSGSLDEFKALIPPGISGSVTIINLMSLCSKRDKLMVGEAIKKRKEDIELPCLICK